MAYAIINGQKVHINDNFSGTYGNNISVPEDYLNYIKPEDRQIGHLSDMSSVLARNIGTFEDAKRGAWNFGVNAISGFTSAVASWEDMFEIAQGEQVQFGNALSDWSREFTQNNNLPIWEENPGSVNPTDSAWWANMIASTGTTIGIMGESFLEASIVSAATGGTGLFAEAGATIGKVSRLGSIFKNISNSALKRAMFTGTYAFEGLKEAAIEGEEAMHTVYQHQLEMGVGEEEARRNAADAAATVYNSNAAYKAITGALTARLMTYSPIKGLEGGILDSMVGKIGNPTARKALGFLAGSTEEAFEEGLQYVIQEEGKYKADMMSGIASPADFSSRISNYVFNGEFWNSAISGAFGGMVIPGFGKLVNKALGRDKNPYAIDHDRVSKMMDSFTLEAIPEAVSAMERGDVETYMQIVSGHSNQLALGKLHLDTLADKGTQLYDEHLNFLKDIHNAAVSGNTETLKKHGADNNFSIAAIKASYPQLIKDTERLQQLYYEEFQLDKKNFDVLIPLVQRRFALEKNQEFITELKSEIDKLELQQNSIGSRSTWGITKKEISTRLAAQNNKVKLIDKYYNALSEEDKKIATQQRKNANVIITKLQKKLTKHFEEDSRSIEEKRNDSVLDRAQVESLELAKKKLQLSAVELSNERLLEDLGNFRSKEYRDKKKEEMMRNMIKTASPTKAQTIYDSLSSEDQTKHASDLQYALNQAANKKATPPKTQKQNLVNIAGNVVEAPRQKPKDKNLSPQQIIQQKNNAPVFSRFLDLDSIEKTSLPAIPLIRKASPQSRTELKSLMSKYIANNNLQKKDFEDVLLHMITERGTDEIKQMYDSIAVGWNEYAKAINLYTYSEQEFEDIYNDAFNYASNDVLFEGFNNERGEGVVVDTESTTNDQVDEPRNITFVQPDKRGQTLAGINKAVISRSVSKVEQSRVDIGDVIVSTYENITGVNENLLALDNPKKIYRGKELRVLLPTEEQLATFNYHPLWSDKTTTDQRLFGKPMDYAEGQQGVLFNDFVKGVELKVLDFDGNPVSVTLKFEKDTDEYWNAVPMMIYDGDNFTGGFMHTEEYLHVSNFNDRLTESEVTASRQETKAIRNEVRENGDSTVVITDISQGLIGVKGLTVNIEPVKISAQDKNDSLTLVVYEKDSGFQGSLKIAPEKIVNREKFIKEKSKQDGLFSGMVSILYPHTDGYWLSSVNSMGSITNSSYYDEIRQSIISAIQLHLGGTQVTVNGKNLNNGFGLINYIKQFVNTNHRSFYARKGALSIKDVNNVDVRIEPGKVSLAPNARWGMRQDGNAKTILEYIGDSIIPKLTANVATASLVANSEIQFIDGQRSIVNSGIKYNTFVKDHFLITNKLFNVGTEEEPFYTPFVNRSIALTRKSILEAKAPEAKTKTDAETVQKNIQEQEKKEQVLIEQNSFEGELSGLTKNDVVLVKKAIAAMSNVISKDQQVIKSINDFVSLTHSIPLSKQTMELLRDSIHAIDKLLPHEQAEFANQLAYDLVHVQKMEYDDTLSDGIYIDKIKESIDAHLKKKETELYEYYKQLEILVKKNPLLEKLIGDYNAAFEKIVSIRNNVETISQDVIGFLQNLNVTVKDIEEDEINYDQTSEQTSVKQIASKNIRKFLIGIHDLDNEGNVKRGFMGVAKFVSPDTVLDIVSSLLADGKEASSYEYFLKVLEENSYNYNWIKSPTVENDSPNDLLTLLAKSDQKTKDEFTYIMSKHALQMKSILFTHETTKDGNPYNWIFNVYDTNSSSNARAILSEWEISMKLKLTNWDNDLQANIFDQSRVQAAFDVIDGWMKKWETNKKQEVYSQDAKVFYDFFQSIGMPLSMDHIEYWKNKPINKTTLSQSLKDGALGNIHSMLKTILEHKEVGFNNQLKQNVSIDTEAFKRLARQEARWSHARLVSSWRDGGKSFYAFTQNTLLTDKVNELKHGDQETIKNLKEGHFSRGSLLLDLFETNTGGFRNLYDSSVVANVALKRMRSKFANDKGLTGISTIDHEVLKIGAFTFMKTKGLRAPLAIGNSTFNRRLGTMIGLTMSDKSRAYAMSTAVIDFRKEHLDNKYINDDVADLLYQHYVYPEIERVLYGHNENIKGYNPNFIYLFPTLNNAMIEVNGEQRRLITVLRNGEYENNKSAIEQKIKAELKELFLQLKNEKIEEWIDYGVITNNEIKIADLSYVKAIGGKSNVDTFVYDYVLNQVIHNAEMFKLYAGDPAYYYKNDHYANLTEDELSPEQLLVVMEDTFINVGKRLAILNAPGNTLANSDRDGNNTNTYYQIYLKDRIRKHETFGKITATDAQEYMTWREFVYVLKNSGRLEDIIEGFTIDEVEEAFKTDVNELSERQKALLNKIYQPIVKPVYTGTVYDPKTKLNRPVYIKSAAFVLVPQLTAGTELDKLRQKMEQFETEETKRSGRQVTVRASYESANKVGAIKNAYNMFNEDESTINVEGLTIKDHALELKRKYFRIQQEVPAKSKHNYYNETRMGTQMVKLMFGDGVINFTFKSKDGKDISGMDMFNQYVNYFKDLTSINVNQFLGEFMIDEYGNFLPEKEAAAIQKLQEILQEEAKDRKYSKQDVNSFKINANGEFTYPIAFSMNADKIEALLHSFVSKRITKIKMPGYSFVVGSEEGFGLQSDFTGVNKSEIVWADKPIDGKLKWNEILVPCRYKINGKDIDLIRDGFAEQVTEDGKTFWKLRKDKMDDELLEVVSFRIPTSKHASMSADKIVGFLPQSAGDLMILSEIKTVLKGLDFDVDKENTYMFTTAFDEKGKLRRIQGDYTQETNVERKKELLLNEIIGIQKHILSDEKVIQKIFEPISTSVAEQNANAITAYKTKNNSVFTPLSDRYQRDKMVAGSSGKTGLGAASLDVVLQAQLEQLYAAGTPLELQIYDTEKKMYVPVRIVIGNQSSSKLGASRTLDGMRSIADVLSEYQNMSADNEKLQILGRVNLNTQTFTFYKMLNLLGFDREKVAGSDIDSIPFLLLNQPILIDYVKEMNKLNSSVGTTMSISEKKQKVHELLVEKYPMPELLFNESLTNKTLIDQLNNPTAQIQQTVLRLFVTLNNYGDTIQDLQTTFNKDSKGLGISFFDTIKDREKLFELATQEQNVANLDKLLGEITYSETKPDGDWILLSKDANLSENSCWLKPSTISSIFTTNALMTAYRTWGKYFPYENPYISHAISVIYGKDYTTDQARKVFGEFKKFVYSDVFYRSFNVDSQKERKRLALDLYKTEKVGNKKTQTLVQQSLVGYLNELKNQNHDVFKNNVLLRNFKFLVENDGTYSTIQYNNSMEDAYGEEDYYRAIINLLVDENTALPAWNGKPYSAKELGEDLVKYAILEGGIQEVIQFVKYLPVQYLDSEELGFVSKLRAYQNELVNFVPSIDTENKIEAFLYQYLGHNPNAGVKIDSATFLAMFEFDKNNPSQVTARSSNTEELSHIYSVSDKKSPGKYKVFVRQKEGVYRLVNPLGQFGMSEYDGSKKIVVSNIHSGFTHREIESTNEQQQHDASTKVDSRFVFETILNNENVDEDDKKLIERFMNNAYVMNTLAKVPIFLQKSRVARYHTEGNFITLSESLLKNEEDGKEFAQQVIHEIVHALTYHKLQAYLKYHGGKLDLKTAPKYIQELVALYDLVKTNLSGNKALATMRRKADRIAAGIGSEESNFFTSEEHSVYGLYDEFEFVSEAFANKEFKKQLYATKVGDKTLSQRFREFVTDIVNLFLGKDQKIEPGSALEAVLHNALALIETDEQNQLLDVVNEPSPAMKAQETLREQSDNTRKAEELLERPINVLPWDEEESKSGIVRAKKYAYVLTNHELGKEDVQEIVTPVEAKQKSSSSFSRFTEIENESDFSKYQASIPQKYSSKAQQEIAEMMKKDNLC